jgi:hypothetical protein
MLHFFGRSLMGLVRVPLSGCLYRVWPILRQESKSRELRCLHGEFEITEGRDGDRQRSMVAEAFGLMARICSVSK